MQGIFKHPLTPKTRGEQGKMLVELNRAPVPEWFTVRDQAIVRLPAGQAGGNHRHTCAEAFVVVDPDAEFHWLDEQGAKHIERFVGGDDTYCITVAAGVPHAVYNPTDHSIMLLEYRDGPLGTPEPVKVV